MNASAVALTQAGVDADGPRTMSAEQVVEEYADGVRDRITRAFKATDLAGASNREKYRGQNARMLGYLVQATENLESGQSFPSARAAAVFYHHTELLAQVWFQELGVPYPAGEGKVRKPETLDDYYG
ncbi:hypothetical protein GCM10027614_20530 [Micromonospora vulcania]